MNKEQTYMEVGNAAGNLQLDTKLSFPWWKFVQVEFICVDKSHLFYHRYYNLQLVKGSETPESK